MNKELIKFIELCLADDVISDKEKKVIFRKAKELGVPKDECEIILDGLVNKNAQKKNQSTKPSKELPTEKLNKKQEDKVDSRQPVKKEKMVEKEDKSSKKSSNLKKYGFGCSFGCLCMVLTFFISMLSIEYLGADILSGFVGMFIFIVILLPIYTYIGKNVAVSLGIIEKSEAFKEKPLTKGINKDIEKFEKRKYENSKTQTETKESKKIVNKDIEKIEKRRGRKD